MEYVIIFLTSCVIDGTVWLFLWCAFSFFPRRKEIEVVVWCRREDEGSDKGSVSLRFSEMRLGRKKGGGRLLAVGESFGGSDLSGVLSQAKNPYVSLEIEPGLPPELSFKGAPSPTLSQRWIVIGVSDMRGG